MDSDVLDEIYGEVRNCRPSHWSSRKSISDGDCCGKATVSGAPSFTELRAFSPQAVAEKEKMREEAKAQEQRKKEEQRADLLVHQATVGS